LRFERIRRKIERKAGTVENEAKMLTDGGTEKRWNESD
jgi:hypothetical protein